MYWALPDSVAGVQQGVQPLVVHVPQDPDRLLPLGLAGQHGGLALEGSLAPSLDLKSGGSWNEKLILIFPFTKFLVDEAPLSRMFHSF